MDNKFPHLTKAQLDAIAEVMDDAIREELHDLREWDSPGQFLTAYMAADADFPIHQFEVD